MPTLPCAQLYSLAETPQTPRIWACICEGATVLVSQDTRHLFVTPCSYTTKVCALRNVYYFAQVTWFSCPLRSQSFIYLSRILCLSSCHPVILASCHNCGTLCYSFSFNNQTDQGDERESFEREGYRWRDRRWRDWRGRVWIDFSLLKAQRKKNVGSQCHLQLLCWTI
jgi:hypothetical protein